MKKHIFCLILSPLLLILAFSCANCWGWIMAWFGFVPLFFVLKKKSKWKAFLWAYFFGIIFWVGVIYWLVHVTAVGMIILILYLALYFGIFGLIISVVSCQLSAVSFLLIPAIWVLLEYLRSHLLTGFGWALLGYSQYLNLPIIQIADITGVWGISFLVMMANVAIYSAVAVAVSCQLSAVSALKRHLTVLLCVIFTLAYGYYKLHHRPATIDHRPLKVSVIQGNIPQALKWNPKSKDFIINRYLTLTSQAVARGDVPDLIIWPEASMPVVLEEDPVFLERLKAFTQEIKIPLLFGAVTLRNNNYYNSAFLLSKDGRILCQYDKLHLVPFGEFIPLRKILRFLETVVPIGDFSEGKEYTVFKVPSNFSVLICFEDLFPELSREFVKKGADFLVNITNDAWFKKSPAPYQHFQASVFRAVENRVFLVRAANTGVSGFIAPSGAKISLVRDKTGRNIFISGYDTQNIITGKSGLSFYTRYGDIFVIICFLFALYGIMSAFKQKSK